MTIERFPLPPESDKNKCYDNTRISQFKTCPRSYLLRHVMGWRAKGTGLALIFGLSWHDAQDVVWGAPKLFKEKGLPLDKYSIAELAGMQFNKTWEANGLPSVIPLQDEFKYSPRTPSIALEMLYSYVDTRWKMITECEVLAIEQPCAVPMPGLPGHWYIGRLDKVIKYNYQKLVLEHKTTTAYSIDHNFRYDYVDSWDMSSQVKGYEFMGNLFFGEIGGVWIDAALVHKKIHNAFKLIPQNHQYVLLQEWIDNTREWIRQISYEEEHFKHNGLVPSIFRKNEESCYGKYGPCQFLDICRSYADPTSLMEPPQGFVHEVWEPFDVLGLNKIVKENQV